MIRARLLFQFPRHFKRFNSTYFSRTPISNHIYINRVNKCLERFPQLESGMMADLIQTSRNLQSRNTTKNVYHDDDISRLFADGIDNTQLESCIFRSLNQYKSLVKDESIIKSYLNTRPRPENDSEILKIVKMYFHSGVNVNEKIVSNALRVMIKNNEYATCFDLIDVTFNSAKYIRYNNKRLFYQVTGSIVSFSGFLYLLDHWFALNSMLSIVIFNSLFLVSMMNFRLKGYRICWRSGIGLWQKVVHHKEFKMVNKILVEFEANHDKNVLNYHLNNVEQLNYSYNGLLFENDNDDGLNQVKKLINVQMLKRKFRLVEDEQEALFKDFHSGGAHRYEWTEPDQDPVDMGK